MLNNQSSQNLGRIMAMDTKYASFPFLLLPTEIRQHIYIDFLKHQCLILGDYLDNPGVYLEDGQFLPVGRRTRFFGLKRPSLDVDNTISLLLTCKQVQSEMQPLLAISAPSHFALSKNLHKLSEDFIKDLGDIGVPFNSISKLIFNAVTLGKNEKSKRTCPSDFLLSCCGGSFWPDEVDGPPEDPGRLPDLSNIYRLQSMFRTFPALCEVHIYDTLKHSFTAHLPACDCPIAGTDSCKCNLCACGCNIYLPLPTLVDPDLVQAEKTVYDFFRTRFRAALPEQNAFDIGRSSTLLRVCPGHDRISDYYTLLDLLAHGVNVYLHEEVAIAVPSSGTDGLPSTKPKVTWRASYHLVPPYNAMVPKQPMRRLSETPGQRRKRTDLEMTSKGIQSCSPLTVECLPSMQKARKLPDNIDAKPIAEFEARLQVYIVDIETAKRDRHWKWD